MWRRLPVGPMPGRDAETGDPMHRPPAVRAVEDELPELPLDVGLHRQEARAGASWRGR